MEVARQNATTETSNKWCTRWTPRASAICWCICCRRAASPGVIVFCRTRQAPSSSARELKRDGTRRSHSWRQGAKPWAGNPVGVQGRPGARAGGHRRGRPWPGHRRTAVCGEYELPNSPEDYVHRIGRTGRAGSKGRGVVADGEDATPAGSHRNADQAKLPPRKPNAASGPAGCRPRASEVAANAPVDTDKQQARPSRAGGATRRRCAVKPPCAEPRNPGACRLHVLNHANNTGRCSINAIQPASAALLSSLRCASKPRLAATASPVQRRGSLRRNPGKAILLKNRFLCRLQLAAVLFVAGVTCTDQINGPYQPPYAP